MNVRNNRRATQWTSGKGHPDRLLGLSFGLLAGGTLLVVVWVIDAWQLSRAGVLLPLAKACIAAACLLVPLGILGLVTMRLRSAGFSALLWLFAGVAFGLFAAQVAFRSYPWALARWAPDAARLVAYQYGVGHSTRAIMCSVICGVLFTLAGMVMGTLVEGTRSPFPAVRILSVLTWVAIFALSGAAVDALIQQPLRRPALVIENLISFRLTAPDSMETDRARQLHASALNPFEDLLPQRHRILVTEYDGVMSVTKVVVDFEGVRIRCTLIDSEPTFCERLR
jgi:hypothetical protein